MAGLFRLKRILTNSKVHRSFTVVDNPRFQWRPNPLHDMNYSVITHSDLQVMLRRYELTTGGPWQSFVEGHDHLSDSSFIERHDRTRRRDVGAACGRWLGRASGGC